MSLTEYQTAGGIRVRRTVETIPVAGAIEPIVGALDRTAARCSRRATSTRAATRAGTSASSIRRSC